MEDILRIVLYVLGGVLTAIVVFAVSRYVIPWLKTKLGDEKLTYILTMVQEFMSAIEENPEGKTGPEKAEWVIDRVMEIFPKLNRSFIKALINGSMRFLEQEGIVNYQKDRHV